MVPAGFSRGATSSAAISSIKGVLYGIAAVLPHMQRSCTNPVIRMVPWHLSYAVM
jgi:hypothetical protein